MSESDGHATLADAGVAPTSGIAAATVAPLWAERRSRGGAGSGTVLIADDDGFSAEALADVLEDEGLSVVGVAIDGVQAVEAAIRLEPDVVLMDLHMPRMDGIEAARRIAEECRAVQVVMLTAYDEAILRDEAARSGVFRYLVKGCRVETIIEAIHGASKLRASLVQGAQSA